MGEFRGQELSNLAWAYATIGHPAPDLFSALEARCFEPMGPDGICFAETLSLQVRETIHVHVQSMSPWP